MVDWSGLMMTVNADRGGWTGSLAEHGKYVSHYNNAFCVPTRSEVAHRISPWFQTE